MICNASQNKQNKQIINPFPTIFIGLWEKMVVLIKHYVQNYFFYQHFSIVMVV